MAYAVIQMRRFARQYKRLNDKNAEDVDKAVAKISDEPTIGEKKKGDLSSLWVFKFRTNDQLYLLGYTFDGSLRLVYLEAIGPHENFYRDLKR